ncbi:hypothetical protein CALVIDRAFT_532021 [Calocera viscosa TUFC12733]|uniref:Myb/SANT-like domain-containing protein n=1 Tax=Calocera viscosa (strain TUFC12733) TaxID=1330018 RepID=A0A167FIQ4_CALVF|nr:hypothetical protein CALVIDRAFT_532021 [Calocera viscosa TUFC12733]
MTLIVSIPDTNKQTTKEAAEKPKVRHWTTAEEEEFVDILNEEAAKGNHSDDSFKPTVWQICVDRLAATFEQPSDKRKGITHVRSRWDLLKKHWGIVHAMRSLSGFGWVEETQMVYAKDESIWAEYLKAHPEAQRFRNKPFPLYDKLTVLCESIIARGNKVVQIQRTSQKGVVKPKDAEVEAAQPDVLEEVEHADDEEDDEEDEEDEEDEAAPVSQKARKRAPSHTPIPRKQARLSGAHGLLAVADAVCELSEAMTEAPSVPNNDGSPIQHKRAIRMLENEPDFSDEERLTAIDLFIRNRRLGDSYLAFSKPALRSRWLGRQLREEGARAEQASQAALFASAWSSSPVPNFDGQASYNTAASSDSLPT